MLPLRAGTRLFGCRADLFMTFVLFTEVIDAHNGYGLFMKASTIETLAIRYNETTVSCWMWCACFVLNLPGFVQQRKLMYFVIINQGFIVRYRIDITNKEVIITKG